MLSRHQLSPLLLLSFRPSSFEEDSREEMVIVVTSEDNISKLPDSILHSILSRISISEAVRTSILAKRWRNVWKSLPSIKFDSPNALLSHDSNFRHSSNHCQILACIVDHVLISHNTHVLNCEIFLYWCNWGPDLRRWIELLSLKGVQELKLLCHGSANCHPKASMPHDLPPSIFGCCRLLRVLELKGMLLQDSWVFLGCDNLTSLILDSVTINSEVFSAAIQHFVGLEQLALMDCVGILNAKISVRNLKSLDLILMPDAIEINAPNLKRLMMEKVNCNQKIKGIIHGCPLLEELILKECSGLRYIQFCATNLKSIDLVRLGNVNNIDIKAPSLTDLMMDAVDCKGVLSITAPNLRSFRTYPMTIVYEEQRRSRKRSNHKNDPSLISRYQRNTDLIGRAFALFGKCPDEELKYSTPTPFENLQQLSINLDLNDFREAIVLAFVLRNCLCLQDLNIMIEAGSEVERGPDPDMLYRETNYWQQHSSFSCVDYHLKTVKLINFTGKHLELEFAKLLVTNATKLRTMIIQCPPDCSKGDRAATRGLLSLPKASSDFRIIIEHVEKRLRRT